MSNYPQNQRSDKPFSRKVLKKSDHGSGLVPHRASLWCGAQKVLTSVLDVVFPKVCLGCGEFTSKIDFDYVCRKCLAEVYLKNTFECIGCKRESRIGLTCVSCKKNNGVDQLLIATELTDPLVEKMIKVYKYKFIYDMATPLSTIVKKCIKKLVSKGFNLFEDNPVLIPVPLHKTRLNERGFNQSWLIVKEIADTFHLSSNENLLSKKYNFKHQADIKTREDRMNNVKNDFAVTDTEVVKGKTVILIDDICTTGATLNECARVLKNPPTGEGAKRVIGFVIARGQFKKTSGF